MKTYNIFSLLAISSLLFSCGPAHEIKNLNAEERTIQVTGSADMSVIPDQIEFLIKIEEYFEEQYQPYKTSRDYKTKVQLSVIEEDLMTQLKDIGVGSDKIKVQNIGGYWRYRTKRVTLSKHFSILMDNVSMIDSLLNKINVRGMDYMRIGELKHEDLQEYRKEVKIEALQAARAKAEYLLSSMGKDLGEIVSIKELNSGNNWSSYWWGGSNSSLANSTLGSGQRSDGVDSRSIKLRYEIQATFEIQ